MSGNQRAVILVGHGGVPKDCPQEWIRRLKQMEGQRRASGQAASSEELELDGKIRQWPRTPENDTYKAGLESLGQELKPLLQDARLVLAYNEFCAPSLKEAVEQLVGEGIQSITVVPSMFTPGGSHSQVEIPESIEELRSEYPQVTLQYAWPFDLGSLATLLAGHLQKFQP